MSDEQRAAFRGVMLSAVEDTAATTGEPLLQVFFYTSPYKRSFQTYKWMSEAFDESQIAGWQEEVQLREQDFGNFQDPEVTRMKIGAC